jgi:hypothetical protein
MAIVDLDPLFKEIHGKVGDLVFRRGPNGKTIVSRAPRQKKGNSRKAQRAKKELNARRRQRMDEAHMYARSVLANPVTRARVEREAKRKKKDAYHMALSNFFKLQKNNVE